MKQGCPLSPTLFRLFIDRLEPYLLQALSTAPPSSRSGILHLGSYTIALLLFADDLVLAATTPASLQWQLDTLHSFCTSHVLTVNTAKTHLLALHTTSRPPITYADTLLTYSDTVTYLGLPISTSFSLDTMISSCWRKARAASSRLLSWLRSHSWHSHAINLLLLDAYARSHMLFGA